MKITDLEFEKLDEQTCATFAIITDDLEYDVFLIQKNKEVMIHSDDAGIQLIKDAFDWLIDRAADLSVGTAFEMRRTSSVDCRLNPPKFDKVWIDLIWSPWEHSGGGIDLHWQMDWQTGRIELKLSKEGNIGSAPILLCSFF